MRGGGYAAALAVLGLVACMGDTGRVVGVEATGTVTGVVFTDVDANGVLDAVDRPVAGAQVSIVIPGTTATVDAATTDPLGEFVIGSVPVGSYELRLPPGLTGDSLAVDRVNIDGEPAGEIDVRLTVAAEDTVFIEVVLAYHVRTVAEIRAMDVGSPVLLDAIALTETDLFGDQSMHVADPTGALRLLDVTGDAVLTGDSVRVLGRVAMDAGHAVLAEARTFVLGAGTPPAPATITTGDIPTAEDGQRPAALVEAVGATVDTTEVVGGDLHVTIDDGSGPALMVLYRQGGFVYDQYVAGTVLDAAGLLRPDAAGTWVLQPRSPADVVIRSTPAPAPVTP